jgi:glycosyltransferase involved in cell wall biosynthesis
VTGLSVVIACRDRATLLTGCLRALEPAREDGAEVIVVDAGSRTDEVARAAAGVRLLRSAGGSASAARNLGWRAASHPLVAFTDDDCRPAPDWAAATVHALIDLSAVCGQVLAEGDGHLSVLETTDPVDYAAADDPALLGHGANLAVRRDALEAVGGWDERLGPGTRGPGAEDKDLLLRLLHAGFAAGYRPEPVVRHLQWRSRRKALKAELGYGRGAGALAAKGFGPSARALAVAELGTALADLRAGYQYGAVAGVLRSSGIVAGRLSGRGLR